MRFRVHILSVILFFLSAPAFASVGESCENPEHPFKNIFVLRNQAAVISGHIKDPCDRLILTHGIDKDMKSLNQTYGCRSNHPCVMKLVLDEAYREILQSSGIPLNILYAIAMKESTFQMWSNARNTIPVEGGGAYGLMQIQKDAHKDDKDFSWQKVESDALVNARKGATLIKDYFERLPKTLKGNRLAFAIYSSYCAGPNSNINPTSGVMERFLEILKTHEWTSQIAACGK